MSTKLEMFLDLVSQQVDKSIYVWGAQGELLTAITPAWITAKTMKNTRASVEARQQNANRAIALYNKRKGIKGAMAFDCSGLVCWGLEKCGAMPKGFDETAATLQRIYCEPIDKSELKPGDLVFHYADGKADHVGIFIGSGYADEAKSSKYGVVRTKLSDRSWNRYGRLKVFKNQMPVTPVTPPPKPTPITGGTCEVTTKIVKKGVTGECVKSLQRLLKALGYKDGDGKAISIDGECGSKTEAAIKNFQKAKGLSDDGICGSKTWDKIING